VYYNVNPDIMVSNHKNEDLAEAFEMMR